MLSSLGLFQLCEYCKRLGATIQCHVEGCSRFYHFPCSAASGSFQSMKQLVLLCPEHIDKAEELGKRRPLQLTYNFECACSIGGMSSAVQQLLFLLLCFD